MATPNHYFDPNIRLLGSALETVGRYGKFRNTCFYFRCSANG